MVLPLIVTLTKLKCAPDTPAYAGECPKPKSKATNDTTNSALRIVTPYMGWASSAGRGGSAGRRRHPVRSRDPLLGAPTLGAANVGMPEK